MGTKKLQGADGMNFQLQLTIKGLESINLPEENLTNESGNDIMKISCWGGKLSAYVNLPNAGQIMFSHFNYLIVSKSNW